MGLDYDSRYEEAAAHEEYIYNGLLDDGILAVKEFDAATTQGNNLRQISAANLMKDALRGIFAIARPDDSDYQVPIPESAQQYDEKLADMHGGQLLEELFTHLEAIDHGVVNSFEKLPLIAKHLKGYVCSQCTYTVGGVSSPPEDCGAMTRPGEEYCDRHRELERLAEAALDGS